ncbi:MAG: ZIP family metal transporter [Nocardioides sp.]
MDLGKTLLLGFIAGVTILIGMPLGRMRRPSEALRVTLNALAIGILMFLVWDVLSAAWEPIDNGLAQHHESGGHLGPVFGYGVLFALGLTVGLLGLQQYEAWMGRSLRRARSRQSLGPGAMASQELSPRGIAGWSAARQLALLIAVGIGLHNFAEGLAIGQAAAGSEIALATLLVIGFALHNATEGFGIVAPLAADAEQDPDARPSWGLLIGLAAIGGGPTFVGTAVGHTFTSEPLAVIFLTLAAGSIIYVIVQLLAIAGRSSRKDLIYYGVLLGLLAGFATDAIVTAAGV